MPIVSWRAQPFQGEAPDGVITTLPPGFVSLAKEIQVDSGWPRSRRGDSMFAASGNHPFTSIPIQVYGLLQSDIQAGVVFVEQNKFWYFDGVDFSDITPPGGVTLTPAWQIDFVGAGVIFAAPGNVPKLWAQGSHPYGPAVSYDDLAVWGWPPQREAVCIRSYQNYLVALLHTDLADAQSVPANFRVRWSNPADIVTIPVWEDDLTLKPDTVAGYVDQETRFGALVDQRVYGADNFLFYQSGVIRMTYAGSVDPVNVFRFSTLHEDDGCIGTGATCVTPEGIVVVGQHSIYLMNGSVKLDIDSSDQLGGATVRDRIYSRISSAESCKLYYAPRYKEVYFAFGGGPGREYRGSECLIYNMDRKAWSELRVADNPTIYSIYCFGDGYTFSGGRGQIDLASGTDTLICSRLQDDTTINVLRLAHKENLSEYHDGSVAQSLFRTDWISIAEIANEARHKHARIRKIYPLIVGYLDQGTHGSVAVQIGRLPFTLNSVPIWDSFGEFNVGQDEYISVDLPMAAYIAVQFGGGSTRNSYRVIGVDIEYELGELE